MKRSIGVLALSLALAGTLVGCSNQNASANPTPTAPAVAPTDSPKPGNTVGKGMEDMARGAGEVARGAVDGIGDAARGAVNGMENAARDAQWGWDNADNVPDWNNGYGWGADGSMMENGSYYSYNVQ